MGAGRLLCVALPFALTVASIICILIAMLAGITNKNLDMFEITTKDLSISSSSIENLIDLKPRGLGDLTSSALNSANAAIAGNNITAAQLGLADDYKISMWNYCGTTGGKTNCTTAKFDWASTSLNVTDIEELASSTGVTVTLPKEVRGALKTFSAVSKWTQVVYIIAIITAAIELVFAIFAICSRIGSCFTFIVSGVSTTAIIIASILATVQSSVVVGSVNTTAKSYGVKANLNTSFLAVTWLAVAFSIGAGLFWLFSICCCASDHSGSKRGNRKSMGDNEKLIPTGSYQRVEEPNHFNKGFAGQEHGVHSRGQEYGVPMHNVKPAARGDTAYEPYAHAAI